MVSTFTPNINLEEPARGDDVGTWDTPVNSNMTVLDLVSGAITTIGLNNSPVVLSAAQFQSKAITFNSTLTGSVAITFPSTFKKSYEVFNNCTGINSFIVTLGTTVAGGQVIGIPPGQIVDVINDGTNLKFKNLSPVGTYLDVATTQTPGWITGCTVPPYLNCDGTSFSSATYPVLAVVLNGNVLPDARGRSRFALDQGAGRISSAVFSTTTVAGAGGSQTTTLATTHLPPYTPTGAIAFANTPFAWPNAGASIVAGGAIQGPTTGSALSPISATFNGNAQGGASTPFSNVPPAFIGGVTLIRAG